MAVVKFEALKWLAGRIACAIPELDGRICVGQSPPNHGLTFPSLAIVPVGKWRRIVYQDDDQVFYQSPGRIVVELGRHEVMVQLQIGCATPSERYTLEQRVEMEVFDATEGHPGIVFGGVPALAEEFGDVQVSAELDDDEWNDLKAFQGQSWSYMDARLFVPMLAIRKGFTIHEVVLGLTDDFASTVTPSSFNTDPNIERVTVNEDGTISPE